jgi:HAD superfamily hydrolase (TIGR01509 family)
VDALLFDFDGVVVDSEPVHLLGFRRVLASVGLTLTSEEYYRKYLGFDDHDCFQAAGRDKGAAFTPEQIEEMTAVKTRIVQETFSESIEALPGAVALIGEAAKAGVPLAICSGALRDEIRLAARTVGVLEHFAEIVSAEDVQRGKPDPEGYAIAASRLARRLDREIVHERCVVVEDSPAGISAGKALGMKVLAVTTSYAAEDLGEADRVVGSLADVRLADLESL